MSDGSTTPIDSVTGGSTGTEAVYGIVRDLAATFDSAGDTFRELSEETAQVLTDGDLVESSVLSPASFAEAEVQVLAAATGPHGVFPQALAYELDALLVRMAVDAYQATDELVHGLLEFRDYTIGFLLGTQAVPVTIASAGLWPFAHDDQAAYLQRWVTTHPDEVQSLVNGGGGLLDGLWFGTPAKLAGFLPFHPTTEAAARELAGLYGPEGEPVFSDDDPRQVRLPVPLRVEDLLRNLAITNDEADGTIDIQTVTGPDGLARHIVYLPGADDLDPQRAGGQTLRDMLTNVRVIGHEETAYQRGIVEAMRRAGLADGGPIMLVGHSQGGMEAMAIAADGPAGLDVTHVVTAGSPTAQVPRLPDHVQALSLENRGDVVPLLDGEDNPEQANRTTVTFDLRSDEIAANHHLTTYVEGAGAVDQSDDLALVDARNGMGAFLSGSGLDGSRLDGSGLDGSGLDDRRVNSLRFTMTRGLVGLRLPPGG